MGGGAAAGGDEHQHKARNRTDRNEQGTTSGRATTPAKQKHGVAHRTRSGGWPVPPGQDKGVAHHMRSGGWPVRPGQENTTDHQQWTTPAVRRRIQQHTNKTSRASSRLQHHKPGWRTTRAREAGPSVPARKTPQTTNTRPRRPYGGGHNSTQTKQAEHPAGYNTTNRNPNTPTQHAPPIGGPHTSTARPNRGGGTHQHSTNPGHAHTTGNRHPTTPAVRRRRQQ